MRLIVMDTSINHLKLNQITNSVEFLAWIPVC